MQDELKKLVDKHDRDIALLQQGQKKLEENVNSLSDLKSDMAVLNTKMDKNETFMQKQFDTLLTAIIGKNDQKEKHAHEFRMMTTGKIFGIITVSITSGGILFWLVQQLYTLFMNKIGG
ncbi:hypothetical protein [Enterococcus sp. 5H]|uniref:hypothetical protein n=1 Tax=Enterococcus sp. 5H TaxID=1229490 RepID=UPI0023035DAF|nr:hypothetical protein [Enterococcus sp. 5H]MDA9472633.1 hypothetical protein [Enterococcus sp. 5H]